MSTPTPDQPTNEAPPESQAAAPPPAVPPAAFAPVPREPWINPRRRMQAAGIGLVAALACLGAGIGIGFAASGDDHRDRPHGVVLMPGRGFGFHPAIYGPHGRFGMWPMPGGPYDNGGSASPSPAPSGTN